MRKSKIFRFLNSLVIVSLIAPILNSATLAIGQESIDDAEIKEVYHNDFENDPSSDPAIQDAGSTLTYTTELVFEGNTNDSGLLVSNRENDWAGIDVRFEPIELQVNQEYNITILGYIDPETEVPEDTELILTTPDTYDWIDNTNELEAGQAYTLEGTYLHTDDEENLAFRVQSNEAGENVDFAVADILITTQELPGTEPIDEDYDATLPDSSNGELGDDNDSEDGLEEEPLHPELDLPSLSAVYADMFSIGNAISSTDMEGPRLELLNHHHNIVTAENAMKPNELVDDEGNFDFEGANTLVERAFEQGHEVHGHVLVWHSQSPDWHHTSSDGQPLSREVALENMYTHIETVMRNFGPEITSWDVVNEALDGDWSNPEDWQSNLRNTGFLRAIGEDYIYLAFAHARRIADELGRAEMALYYNDYNDHIQPKAQTMYHMIKDINEQWAAENPDDDRKLISGVGMQGHYSININPENVKQSIERFEELGIEIGITELDVTTNTANQYIESELIRQGQIYARLFQIFREHADSIDRVTFWGLNDSNSWRSDRYPLLFDDTLRAKPAYYAVLNPDSFLVEHPLEQTVGNQSYAVYGTPDLGTDELDALWSEAPVLTMNQMQQAHEIHASGNGRVLWDEENLYVLFQVADSVLDASHSEAHEQDSVEAFVNETGEQGFSYFEGVGQYRVNYENVATFNPGQYSEGFESYANITGTGYVVEMAIPWKYLTPEVGQTIGFDMQINDAVDGGRHGVVAWNDDSGQGWTDPSVFGKLTLVTSLDDVEEPTEPDD